MTTETLEPRVESMSRGALQALVGRELGRPARVQLQRNASWDLELAADDCMLRLHPGSGPYDLLLGASLLSSRRSGEVGSKGEERQVAVQRCRERLTHRYRSFPSQAGRLAGLDDAAVVRRVSWGEPTRAMGGTPLRERWSPLLEEMPIRSGEIALEIDPSAAEAEVLDRELTRSRSATRRFRECFRMRHRSRPMQRGVRTRTVLGIDACSVGTSAPGEARLSRRFTQAVLHALGGLEVELHAVAFVDSVGSEGERSFYETRTATLHEPLARFDRRALLRLDRAIEAGRCVQSPASGTAVQIQCLLDLAGQAIREENVGQVQIVYFGTRGLGRQRELSDHWVRSARLLEERFETFDREHAVPRESFGLIPSALRHQARRGGELAAMGALVAARSTSRSH